MAGSCALKGAELDAVIEQVGNGWRIADELHLQTLYKTP